MKHLKIKRLLPLLMAAAVALTGCGGKGQIDEGKDADPAGSTAANQAMGRYVEAELPLPEMLNQNLAFVSHGRGEISFLARESEPELGSYRTLRDGEWAEYAPDWLLQDYTGLDITELIYGLDGNTYLLSADYNDENQTYHLYRLNPDKTRTELLADVLAERDEMLPQYSRMPDRVFVLSDGRILLSEYTGAAIYSADGTRQVTIAQSRGISNYRITAAVTEEEYITISPDGDRLARFDLHTGRMVAEISYNERYNGAIAADEDGGVYVCDERGIHYWAQDGTLWQTLVDGELNSLSMPSRSMMYLFLGENDDFYAVAIDRQSTYYVYHYSYDEGIPAVPSKTLAVFSLNDNATVRQAISLFQKENPDIRIDYRVALDGSEGGALSDIIKALNTELLNGNGADVLLLDGLPIKSYIEKGVLMDLSDIIRPLVTEGDLLQSMVSVYGDEDGIYSVPIRFLLPLVYGDEDGLEALKSLEALNSRAEEGIMPVYRDGILIRKLLTIFYNDIFLADGSIDYDGVEKLFMTAENLAAAGYYSEDISDMTKELLDSMLEISDDYGFSTSEFVPLDLDLTKTGITMTDGINSLFFPNEVINRKNLSIGTLGGLFIPTQLAGINSSSSQAEEGKAFIKTLLSAEIQNTDLSDGLPVNEGSLKKWMGEELDNYYLAIGYDNYHISAVSPAAEELERLYGLAYDVTTPVLKEQVLWDMIEEEGAGYLNGSISLAEAMERIKSRTRLYFAE